MKEREAQLLAAKKALVEDIRDLYAPKVYKMMHLSTHKIETLHEKNNFEFAEPRGLHYATHFARFYEEDYATDKLLYGVVMKAKGDDGIYTTLDKPDKTKVLVLRNRKEALEFKRVYGADDANDDVPMYHWDAFVKKFGGIEWRGDSAYEFDYKWPRYGCITNPKIIDKLVIMASRKRNEKTWCLHNVVDV